MPTPARFTFDLDLRHPVPAPTTGIALSDLEDQVSAARSAGYAQGFADGEGGIAASAARKLAQAAETLADAAEALLTRADAEAADTRRFAVTLAASIGRKLAAHLTAREPQAELSALIGECLTTLDGVPHLVVRCHPELADAVRAAAEARIAQSRFTGRLIVMGEPGIGLADGRLEWADGGMVRDTDAILQAIDDQITAYFAASVSEETVSP